MKGKRPSSVILVMLLAASFALHLGSTPTLAETAPKLPVEFLETPILDIELNAYLYTSQEQSTIMPMELLLPEQSVPYALPVEVR